MQTIFEIERHCTFAASDTVGWGFRKCWKIFVADFDSDNNASIVFDGSFQTKNSLSSWLKKLAAALQ